MKASEVIANLQRRFPNEPEYIQAVSQVLGTIEEEYNKHPEFEKANSSSVSAFQTASSSSAYLG